MITIMGTAIIMVTEIRSEQPADLQSRGLPRRELPALTSIRALLAWWVVAYHALPTPPFGFGSNVHWLMHGPLAVDCFFVLSGFVLCHVHPVIIGAKTPRPVADFLVNRLARIYPLHLVMLAAFLAVVLIYRFGHAGAHSATGAFSADTLPSFLRNLFLLHGWLYADKQAWNVPSWSISNEWVAYCAAPLIFLCLGKLSRVVCLILAGLVGAAVIVLTATGIMANEFMALPQVVIEFLLGALLRTILGRDHGRLLRIRTACLVVGWAVAAIIVFTHQTSILLAAMIWVMFFLALRTRRAKGVLGRIEAVTIYLGETSFAVYMSHAFILMLWGGTVEPRFRHFWDGHQLLALLVLIIVIQGFASLLHHLVERPAQRRIRRGFRGWASHGMVVSAGPREALGNGVRSG